jgi:hypothetical protein
LRGTGGGATPTPSPNGPRHLDRSRRRPHIRSRRAHARRFRRRPAAVAAFVYAAIGVPLTVANDAGAGFLGVVLLLAALAAGTASVVPQAALRETDSGDIREQDGAGPPASEAMVPPDGLGAILGHDARLKPSRASRPGVSEGAMPVMPFPIAATFAPMSFSVDVLSPCASMRSRNQPLVLLRLLVVVVEELAQLRIVSGLRSRLRHLQRHLLEFRGCLLPDALARNQRGSPGTCAAQRLADSGTRSHAAARRRAAAAHRLLDQRRSADGDLPAACCPEPGPVPLTNVADTSNAAVNSTIVSARSRRGVSQLK